MPSPADMIATLRGTVVPAVLTPMRLDGQPDYDALVDYAAAMVDKPIGGVAVWAHTGRALFLDERQRAEVLRRWRSATDLPIVAGAGVPVSSANSDVEGSFDQTERMARAAADLGADAIMVYPPRVLRGSPGRFAKLLELHERIASASHLPVLGFHLHDEAGGYRYERAFLDELLAQPAVIGVKAATLDRAIDCQDTLAACAMAGKLAVTGEDRMFGPSYMWGADSALVGIGAAAVDLTCAVTEAWASADYPNFVRASERLDRFAAVTFDAPIEGYVQRMMWVAAAEGAIVERAALDPFGVPLPTGERERVIRLVDELRAEASQA